MSTAVRPTTRGTEGPAPGPTVDLRAALRGALPVWLGSRLAVLLLTWSAARVVVPRPAEQVPGLLQMWDRWDVGLFVKVARYGWFAPEYSDHTAVDFPGMPLALRLVHLVVPDWVAAGLVVSLLAGGVASVALWQLAEEEHGPGAGRVAVASLVLMPYAVFLAAGYSEGLFLAFATTAWLAGRHDRWVLASVLGAAAAGTRVNGIALALGLAVQYLVQRRRASLAQEATSLWSRRGLRGLVDARAPFLALPALAVLGFVVHLHRLSGSWTAYSDAQREGWGRGFAMPWEGWRVTWFNAVHAAHSSEYLWFWRAELLAAVVGVVLAVVLVAQRRWGESVFVASNTLIMTATTFYASGVRSVLVWFPLYLVLARTVRGRPLLQLVLVCLSAPLCAALAIAFTNGIWVD